MKYLSNLPIIAVLKISLYLCFICLLLPFACQRDPIAIPSDELYNVHKPLLNFKIEQIKTSGATVTATIVEPGNLNILGYGCIWDTNSVPSLALSSKIEMVGKPSKDTFSFSLPALLPEELYFVRIFLILSKDTIYFSNPPFQTLSHWRKVINDHPGQGVPSAGFFINGIAYFGASYPDLKYYYSYNLSLDKWESLDPLPNNNFGYNGAVGFDLNNIGYFATGSYYSSSLNTFIPTKHLWSYNVLNGQWMPQADFGGSPREGAVAFSLHGIGYVGLGFANQTNFNDFWAYNPDSKTWNEVFPPFPGKPMGHPNSFTIGDKAYIGCGYSEDGSFQVDWWEFDPMNSQMPWRQMDPLPVSRFAGFAFSANGVGYLGAGLDGNSNVYHSDFWSFNPTAPPGDQWNKLKDWPGGKLWYAKGLGIDKKGMVVGGAGLSGEVLDTWIYDPQ